MLGNHIPFAKLQQHVCTRCRIKLAIQDLAWRRRSSTLSSKTTHTKIPVDRFTHRSYFSTNGLLAASSGPGSLQYWQDSRPSLQQTTRQSRTRLFPRSHTSSSLLGTERKSPDNQGPSSSQQLTSSAVLPPPSHVMRITKERKKKSAFGAAISPYLTLTKPRLTTLMVLTTATSYSLYPTSPLLASTPTPSLSAFTLLYLVTCTGLCSASANTLNMYLEPEHDAKMSRTRNRPLVRQVIPPRNALAFAAATSVLGVAGLYYGVNPTVAFLGGFTIFLYAGVYTPLKRISVVNTWVGAVVGGIPPLMGWAAASGQTAVSDGTWQELLLGPGNAGGWLLAGLLFAWQFPHFNALSYMIREEYAHAGYRMLASVNPARNARVALRYSLLFFPICVGLSYAGVTDWGFAVTSTIVNAWITREAIRFWRKGGAEGSARTLFWAGVWHLPVLMVLAMAHKSGLWHGVWEKLGFGEEINEEEWEYEEEHAESPIKTGVAIDTDGHEIASDQVLAARHLAT